MNAYVVIVIVSLIGTIIYDLWQKNKTDKKRNEIMNCILSMMKEKKYTEIYEFLDCDECRVYLPEFNILNLKLNTSLLSQNDKMTEVLLKDIDNIYISNQQKEEIYLKAFAFFCRKQSPETLDYKEKILNITKNKEKRIFVERMFNIYYEKGSVYLDLILNETEKLPENKRIGNYVLLEQIYLNKNDLTNAEKYKKLIHGLSKTIISDSI